MLNEEFLSQDIDILPDMEEETNWSQMDIMPDVQTEEWTEETTTGESAEVDEWTLDPELEALFADAFKSQDETSETIEDASEKITEAMWKLEEVQWNLEDPNAENLLTEIYQDLLQTETSLQASEIARWVAESKVAELQARVSELELNAAGQYQTDMPELMIINKLVTSAIDWDEGAKTKVKSAINRLYLTLTNNTIEEDNVKKNLENVNDSWISLNEKTLPWNNPEEEEEQLDPTDLMSILG